MRIGNAEASFATQAIEAKDSIVEVLQFTSPIKELKEIQRLYIQFVLARCGGNKVHAAKALGIDRRTIQRMVRGGRLADCRKPASVPPPTETKPYPLESAG